MSFRWGIIPAAGLGTRIQPLAFSKELLPVGTRFEGTIERPRAVSEHLIDRMVLAGVERICFVISPAKTDIVSYFGARIGNIPICYVVQQNPNGLCDSLFSALPFVSPTDHVLIGLPDTIWFPESGFTQLPDAEFSFLLFPVKRPELFDSVTTELNGAVVRIQVKEPDATSKWVWGAFKLTGHHFAELYRLWVDRRREDEYLGTLVNAYIAAGSRVYGIKRGETYVDVGTLHGYREAVRVLSQRSIPHAIAS